MQEDIFNILLEKINALSNKVDNLQLNKFKPIKEVYLFEWLKEWVETYKLNNVGTSQLHQINVCIELHIKPNMEDKLLINLTSLDIQKCLNKIKSSRTAESTYYTLLGAITSAYDNKLIEFNLMNNVKKPKHIRKVGKALSSKELSKFIKCLDKSKYKNLFKAYLLTGCRKSELLNIKWSDIDYKNELIHIPGTKTELSNRYIPLFKDMKIILNELKSVPHKQNDLVFNYTPNQIDCAFKRLKTKYKFNFKIHDLRHTFATTCLENGISMKVIQKWLGHSNMGTTSKIYTHISDKFDKLESKKFNMKI